MFIWRLLTISFLYSKRWWSLLCCWWHEELYKLHRLPAPGRCFSGIELIYSFSTRGPVCDLFLSHSYAPPPAAHGGSSGQGQRCGGSTLPALLFFFFFLHWEPQEGLQKAGVSLTFRATQLVSGHIFIRAEKWLVFIYLVKRSLLLSWRLKHGGFVRYGLRIWQLRQIENRQLLPSRREQTVGRKLWPFQSLRRHGGFIFALAVGV